ncbi:hypothetical protein [Brevundimonas diminuta]|uniref:hypothetical protein n=1 Tax=Brevundimonas diminuta TaxID=293 RepID=UPI003F7DC334
MMDGMFFCALDWGAIATFAAGAMAVSAALLVGMWQHDILMIQATIQNRQSEILAGQLALEQQRAKAELYDRRLHVYSAARAWLTHIHRERQVPQGTLDDEFKEAVDRATFLFPKSVSDELAGWMITASRFRLSQSGYEQAGGTDLKKRADLYYNQLAEALAYLPDLFADQLSISEV